MTRMTNPEQREKIARDVWKRACVGREGYCSSDLQDAAIWAIGEAFRMAEQAARSATLPSNYQWSEGNREKFYFGRDSAADAIIALDPAPESAIPAGMVAWAGGEEAPADWPRFARVVFRNGEASQGATEYDWRHYDAPYDILAYTPRPAPDVERISAALARIGEPLRVDAFNDVVAGKSDFTAMIVRDDEPGCSAILAQQLQDQMADDIVATIAFARATLARSSGS